MYLEYFGFRQWPFSMVPNPEFFLNLPSHQAALNTVLVGVKTGEGFIKVTGPVGAGKTLLCRKLLQHLGESSEYWPLYLPNPPVDANDLLHTVLTACKSRAQGDAGAWTAVWYNRLQKLQQMGKRVVVLVDEAQAWPDQYLETIRLWSNWQADNTRYLQVILVGQPELDKRLRADHLRQLLQRISFSHQLIPMTRKELTRYVTHRLAVAGGTNLHLFEKTALDQLYSASKGLPRLVNLLAHKSLMVAYGRGVQTVSWREVRVAILDTEAVSVRKSPFSSIGQLWRNLTGWFAKVPRHKRVPAALDEAVHMEHTS